MALHIVESDPLLQMFAGRRKVAYPERGVPHGIVSGQKQSPVLDPFGQAEEFLGEIECRPVLRPQLVEFPEPPQHGDEFRWLTDLLTELARAGVRPAHLGRGKSPHSSQRDS